MSEQGRPQFSLADAMILVAATTPGLVLIRIANGLGLFAADSSGKTPLGRELVEYFCVAGGCILTPLMLAVLVLRVRQLRPNPREAFQGPGFMACVAVLVATPLPVAYYVVAVILTIGDAFPIFSVPFNNLFGRLAMGAGPMIVGAWLAMVCLGRWKVSSSWADRLGCVLGILWILIYVYAELYFIVHPLFLWLRR